MSSTRASAIGGISAAAALLLAGAAAGYWWAHKSTGNESTPAAARGPSGQGPVLYWYDPMAPNQHFDKPGKSPFMDMQLLPRYASEGEGASTVRVSPTLMQNLGVRLGKVERVSLPTRLHAVGSVTFDERLLQLVQARVDGYITQLHVKAPLVHVRRGEPLATVLAPQWLEAQQEYLTLLDATSESAPALRAAARERLTVLGVPDAAVRTLEEKRQTTPSTIVRSPIDGVVTELGAREGAAFATGGSLFRINGLTSVWVNAQIPEARVSVVPMGSTVQAHATAWPGRDFKGRVIALLPQVDPQTRTFTVRVALDNPDFRLSPGMWVALDFTGPAVPPQLVVPSEAVISTGERSVVITAKEGGSFDVVEVSTGLEEDGRTPILSGLREGESVVLSGQFLIDSEANLKSTVDRLEAGGSPAMPATGESRR
jgi:membrane fusion protein, copper/silver efflux system